MSLCRATPELERLLQLTRDGDPNALAELERQLKRRGDEPWGVALAVREPLYAAVDQALTEVAACVAGAPRAAVGCAQGFDTKLIATSPQRAQALLHTLQAVAAVSMALTWETAEDDEERPVWAAQARVAVASAAVAARGVARRARMAPHRKKEVQTLAELARWTSAFEDLARALRGSLASAVCVLEVSSWLSAARFGASMDPVPTPWNGYFDYDDINGRCVDGTLLGASMAVLRGTGRLEVQVPNEDSDHVPVLELDARLLRKGWLKALVAANRGMGGFVREQARASWEELLDRLRPDHDVAVDALRRTLELWRAEEGRVMPGG